MKKKNENRVPKSVTTRFSDLTPKKNPRGGNNEPALVPNFHNAPVAVPNNVPPAPRRRLPPPA